MLVVPCAGAAWWKAEQPALRSVTNEDDSVWARGRGLGLGDLGYGSQGSAPQAPSGLGPTTWAWLT